MKMKSSSCGYLKVDNAADAVKPMWWCKMYVGRRSHPTESVKRGESKIRGERTNRQESGTTSQDQPWCGERVYRQ